MVVKDVDTIVGLYAELLHCYAANSDPEVCVCVRVMCMRAT